MKPYILWYAIFCFVFLTCSDPDQAWQEDEDSYILNENEGFHLVKAEKSGLNFINKLTETAESNYILYTYFYNGGGVAVGDIDNDGLPDLYFSSNQEQNALYRNKDNFQFEDITAKAGVEDTGGWTTGVSMTDINQDGFLDIYVCKSGPVNDDNLRKNKLYINNGDGTFTEKAQAYGLADPAYSTQAYFLDYDKDGDVDMYLVNHRFDFANNARISSEIARDIQELSRDKLYRNNGNGSFSDVSEQAGIRNKAWGLSASVLDINNDGWPDIHVCNDFLEPDFLYVNNGNGTFTEKANEVFNHLSFYSMGSDAADFNNDGLTDVIALDMVSEDHVRSKRNMASMDTRLFYTMVRYGFHFQYMHNALQLNNGNGTFSEIGQLAGIAKTDWSWAPLFADLDNDGWKDLVISNGIKRDVTDNDFMQELGKARQTGQKFQFQEMLDMMPEAKLHNYAYRNSGDLSFEDYSSKWGFQKPVNSNGMAYADLDGDGDLDLVMNNLDEVAHVYENRSGGNFIRLKLEGSPENKLALGSMVQIETNTGIQFQTLYLSRGFESSVEPIVHFGLGEENNVKKIRITWPDGKETLLSDVPANSLLDVAYSEGAKLAGKVNPEPQLLQEIDLTGMGINYRHKENDYDDFEKELLLPHKQSAHGPCIAVADVNGDGLEDFFAGGAVGTYGSLFIQQSNGRFKLSDGQPWEQDWASEDLGVLFFDADGDGDLDLYVASGGNEFREDARQLQDRLYINNGKGRFAKAENSLPVMLTSSKVIKSADIDGDGDLDLFVGGRVVPGKYPFAPRSWLLQNDGGKFTDITPAELQNPGMVTGAVFSDYDQNGDPDLILNGEWMPVMVFQNEGGKFSKKEMPDFEKTRGLWFSLAAMDVNGDGLEDYLAGNLGLNSKFRITKDKVFHIYCADFDDNGSLDIVLSNEVKGRMLPVRGKQCSSEQMPFLTEKFPTFQSFAEADLETLYSKEKLSKALHYQADMLQSVLIINKGGDKFELINLPNEAQFSPIQQALQIDITGDGNPEIIGAGNLFGAEVETTRYDASKGFVFSIEPDGSLRSLAPSQTGFLTSGDVKDLVLIKTGPESKPLILVARNNAPLQGFVIHDKTIF